MGNGIYTLSPPPFLFRTLFVMTIILRDLTNHSENHPRAPPMRRKRKILKQSWFDFSGYMVSRACQRLPHPDWLILLQTACSSTLSPRGCFCRGIVRRSIFQKKLREDQKQCVHLYIILKTVNLSTRVTWKRRFFFLANWEKDCLGSESCFLTIVTRSKLYNQQIKLIIILQCLMEQIRQYQRTRVKTTQ